MLINLKTKEQIDTLDHANAVVHEVLDKIETSIFPGVTTQELDVMAEALLRSKGAAPAFKGYMGFPATLCVSINEEVVHGIPSERAIQEGDIVSVDCGAIYDGFFGDAAQTFVVGNTKPEYVDLVNNTRDALKQSVDILRVGNSLYDFCKFMSDFANKFKYGNIKKFCGHGIGDHLHEPPNVLNYIDLKEPNIHFQEGLVLALEPMFTLGTSDVKLLDDKWTVVTADGSMAAHWEVSVAICKNGPKVLGRSNGIRW